MKITTRCGSGMVAQLNEALVAKAVETRLVKTNRVRVDTTVVEANVAYPTDSGLLTKAVGRIGRLVERIHGAGAASRTRVVDHRGAVQRHAHSIGVWLRRRSDQAKDEVLGITGQIADLAEAAVVNARRHLARDPGQARAGRLRQMINDLNNLIAVTHRVVDQTHTRIDDGMPPGSHQDGVAA